MAFKGETSLSKIFNAISRFSEDVDVTIAYHALDDSFDPYDDEASQKSIGKFKDRLDELVETHIREVVVPGLRSALKIEFGLEPDCVTIDPTSGQSLLVNYPSAMGELVAYLSDRVVVEFGSCNSILPSDIHQVVPYLAESDYEIDFPKAAPNVLSPMRTFWEKATLMHVECNRSDFRSDATRISRHWYDLDRLALGEIGAQAMVDRDLLTDVVRVKKVFYNSGYANYDACCTGALKLVPDDAGRSVLKRDYDAMVRSGMLEVEAPDFEGIIERLQKLEVRINQSS
jgi:hypothetical protein